MRIGQSMMGIYESTRSRVRPACWALAAIATLMACASPAGLSDQAKENAVMAGKPAAPPAPAALACGQFPAPLPGSTFEGANGDFTAACAGDTDWASLPVASVAKGIDITPAANDNSFGQGTKEDNSSVTVGTGSIPNNKADLTRFYVASEVKGGSNFLYLGWERASQAGSVDMDFELNQNTQPDLTTAGAKTLNRTAGDVLITYDFGGSGAPALGLLKWLTAGHGDSVGDCFKNSKLPCWGKRVDLSASGFAQGAVNTASVTDPFINPPTGAAVAANLFGEAAINLTAAGVFPPGTCEAFGSAFLKSRSSFAFDSEIKDFIAPIPVSISNCGTITIHKVTNEGQTANFGYTTTGGLTPSTFTLHGGAAPGDSTSYTGVQPGDYTVTESTIPSGWTLSSLSCTASGTGTSGAQDAVNLAKANITIAAGGSVDCTYTNHKNLSPTIATTLSVNTGQPIGTTVHDSSTLSGATANAGGTVTYTVYTDNTCTQGAQSAGTKTVTNGVVPDSDPITFNSAGTFYWQAVYSGDANNDGATSLCTSEVLIINPNSTTTVTAQKLLPNDTATLSGLTATAGGTVTFQLFDPSHSTCVGTAAYTETVSVSGNGDYSTTNGTDPLTTVYASALGTWRWQVTYSGDANNSGSSSACGVEQFTIADTN